MDLVLQLLNLWISRGNPPDILSREYPGDESVIRFEWFSGRSREYGYTPQRYKVVWDAFNQYWNSSN